MVFGSIQDVSETALARILRQTVRLVAVHEHGPGYYTIAVASSAGAEQRLFLKLHSTGPNARVEVHCYNHLLEGTRAAVVPCIDAQFEEPTGAHVLLADVSRTHRLGSAPEVDAWRHLTAFANELAKLHATWWGRRELLDPGFVPPVNALVAHQEFDRARSAAAVSAYATDYIGRHADGLSRQDPDLLRRVETCLRLWADQWPQRLQDASTACLIHGDAHAGNFFVCTEPGRGPLLFDFDVAKRSIGPMDLSFLVLMLEQSSGLDARSREEEAIKAYHAGLVQAGIGQYSVEDCRDDYRLGVLAYGLRVMSKSSFKTVVHRLGAFKRAFDAWIA